MSVRSEFILGRKTNEIEFNAGREFTVSVYRRGDKLRYTDPVGNDPWAAKPSVIYRIRVMPKPVRKKTEVRVYDRSTGRTKPFNLTPRRKEILHHIAYDWELRPIMRPNFAYGGGGFKQKVLQFYLGETNIHQIVMLLRQAKLVKFNPHVQRGDLHITPLGMQVLLDTIG